MTLAAWATVLSVVLVGSTGSGGAVYWLLNRNSERAQVNKINADRESTLADAAEKWSKLLDESSTKAYHTLEVRCDSCLEELGGMRDIAGNLIDALEALLTEDTPQSRADAKASVRLARRAMTH